MCVIEYIECSEFGFDVQIGCCNNNNNEFKKQTSLIEKQYKAQRQKTHTSNSGVMGSTTEEFKTETNVCENKEKSDQTAAI